jgi:protein-tyrosine-phosphatase/ketosteroid isomerase-like protein
VFVCEHGGAKSVVAAALFNARAAARNLPFTAESRGVAPDAHLAPAAVAGLRADGLRPDREIPLRVGRADVDGAAAVVAIDALPPDLAKGARVVVWDAIPPISVDYAASRDAMLPRIDALLDNLARERGNALPRLDKCLTDDPRSEVERAVHRFAAAFRAGDVAQVDSLLHERYVHTNAGKKSLSREAWMNWFRDRSGKIKKGELEVLGYEVRDLEIAMLPGTAVVTGTVESVTRASGATDRAKVRFTNVWACSDGRWMRLAFHDAPAVDSP